MNANSFLKWSARVALVFCGVAAASVGRAAPVIDPALDPYFNGQPLPKKIVTVIALFEDQTPVPQLRHSFHSSPAIRKALVKNSRASQAAALQMLRQPSFRTKLHFEPLWLVNAMIIRTRPSDVRGLVQLPRLRALFANRTIELIQPIDRGPVSRPALANMKFTYGLELLNIPKVREVLPDITGEGVRVGILDTGIDAAHPDLTGKLVAWKDLVGDKREPYDDHGHGTHVAGTIAGGNASKTEIGVAPKASLVVGKIFSRGGSTTLDAILKGMQWAADPDGDPATADAPRLISNSWGGGSPSPRTEPKDDVLCVAVENWTKLGILPVFANGNSGPTAGSVNIPGACPSAFGVGATDKNDAIARFSSRGPARWKTGDVIKPNASAPGVDVISAVPGGNYRAMSGTSMATPHTAGLSALLYQAAPNATVEEMSTLIMKSSKDLGSSGNDNDYGMGRIDALSALKPAMSRGGLRRH